MGLADTADHTRDGSTTGPCCGAQGAGFSILCETNVEKNTDKYIHMYMYTHTHTRVSVRGVCLWGFPDGASGREPTCQ